MTLAQYLAHAGLTQAGFAQQIGVSQTAVGRYALGLRVPRPAIQRRIMTATNGAVTPADLVFAMVPISADNPPCGADGAGGVKQRHPSRTLAHEPSDVRDHQVRARD
jgi:transcriptional regulator with XRE-family HTH domain